MVVFIIEASLSLYRAPYYVYQGAVGIRIRVSFMVVFIIEASLSFYRAPYCVYQGAAIVMIDLILKSGIC